MIYESKNLFDQVFQFLRANGLCRSKADYSRRFLGRSRTYWNAIIGLGRAPSPEATITLVLALENISGSGLDLSDRTSDALGNFIYEIKATTALHQKEVDYATI
jgi:HEAT repeat protein